MAVRIWLSLLCLNFAFPLVGLAQEVPSSPTEVCPLLVGATIPDTSLRAFDDEETTLHAAVGDFRAVLIFYRGGW